MSLSSMCALFSLGRRFRRLNRPRRPDRGTHRHVAAAGAGQRALDEEQLALGIDADDLDVLHRAFRVTQMACHTLSWKHAPRILVLPDRARLPVGNRVAVTRTIGGKMVPLDHAGETLALRGS